MRRRQCNYRGHDTGPPPQRRSAPASSGSGLNQRGCHFSPRFSRSCNQRGTAGGVAGGSVLWVAAAAGRRGLAGLAVHVHSGMTHAQLAPTNMQHAQLVPTNMQHAHSHSRSPCAPPAASPPGCTWPQQSLRGGRQGGAEQAVGGASPAMAGGGSGAGHRRGESSPPARLPTPPAHPSPDELPSSSSARSGRRRESEGSGLMPPSQLLRVWAKWVKPYGSSAGFSAHCGQAGGQAGRQRQVCVCVCVWGGGGGGGDAQRQWQGSARWHLDSTASAALAGRHRHADPGPAAPRGARTPHPPSTAAAAPRPPAAPRSRRTWWHPGVSSTCPPADTRVCHPPC